MIICHRGCQRFLAVTPFMTILFTSAAQIKRLLYKYSSECDMGSRQWGKKRGGEVKRKKSDTITEPAWLTIEDAL